MTGSSPARTITVGGNAAFGDKGASMADDDLSAQFERISDKARAAADTLRAASVRSKDQLEKDVASAQERAVATTDHLKAKADDARNTASSHWQQVRGKWHAHVAQTRARADKAKTKIDAEGAAMDVDLTEAYAYDAIDFALDAIQEAEYAVLDAMYARAAVAALKV
jgi:hypothetical protein